MKNAIIMASGLGTRMLPLTQNTPKPLLQVQGMPMIESIILALKRADVDSIYIVVGYLGDSFLYLQKKYDNIHIRYNNEYRTVNNISSVKAAADILEKGDCFICEADLYIRDIGVCCAPINNSCYFGKMVKGYSDDWIFKQDNNGNITYIGKGGYNCYNMVGIAYFLAEDAVKLKKCIEKEYLKGEYSELFWDDVVNKNINMFNLKIHSVEAEQIIELDTVSELEMANKME